MTKTRNTTEKRKNEVLHHALNIASAEGLEGLTIGRLAKNVEMSKSGLFAYFGSKEELQLATIQQAQKLFREQVWRRVTDVEAGIIRLRHMLRCWIHHIEHNELKGGCFFAAASTEFDGRPGDVRDRIVRLVQSWIGYLEQEIGNAIAYNQISIDTHPARLTFELHALVQEANLYRQLLNNEQAFNMARDTLDQRLLAIATEEGRLQLQQDMAKNKQENLS
jgi:AcrR family transcriptional regulator